MAQATRQQQRRMKKLLQTEARWLQRILFGLNKAQEAREKLADLKGEDVEPIHVDAKKGTVTLDSFREALTERTEMLIDALTEERSVVRGTVDVRGRKAGKGIA